MTESWESLNPPWGGHSAPSPFAKLWGPSSRILCHVPGFPLGLQAPAGRCRRSVIKANAALGPHVLISQVRVEQTYNEKSFTALEPP